MDIANPSTNNEIISQENLLLKDSEKPTILFELLKERYAAEHNMRERSTTFVIWVLGLGIALIWVLLIQVHLSILQKIITCVFITSYTGFSFKFIHEISQGFKSNRKIIVKIENLLGFHTTGYYIKNDSIFPEHYKINYNKYKPSSHFASLYWLLTIVAIFIILITIANPVKIDTKTSTDKIALNSSSKC